MIVVFLGSVGISNISFGCRTHRMVSTPMSGDGGVFPFGLGVLQESGDVVAADMVRFFNASK